MSLEERGKGLDCCDGQAAANACLVPPWCLAACKLVKVLVHQKLLRLGNSILSPSQVIFQFGYGIKICSCFVCSKTNKPEPRATWIMGKGQERYFSTPSLWYPAPRGWSLTSRGSQLWTTTPGNTTHISTRNGAPSATLFFFFVFSSWFIKSNREWIGI